MDTCKVLGAMLAFVTVMCLASPTRADPVWADDFEDGAIDPSLWEWGGARRGVGGFGSGSWDWSHEEIVAPDGYLSTRVWGPTSPNTYGGEGWVQTTYDYNDGSDYIINFMWEAVVGIPGDYHTNWYAIQITDGTIPGGGDVHWFGHGDGLTWTNAFLEHTEPDMALREWSVYIDGTNDTVTLFEGPDNTWPVSGEGVKTLPSDQAWYLRFIHSDATSAGYPAGDNLLNLYDFSSVPEPGTLSLLLLGGLVALKRRR